MSTLYPQMLDPPLVRPLIANFDRQHLAPCSPLSPIKAKQKTSAGARASWIEAASRPGSAQLWCFSMEQGPTWGHGCAAPTARAGGAGPRKVEQPVDPSRDVRPPLAVGLELSHAPAFLPGTVACRGTSPKSTATLESPPPPLAVS